MRIENHLAQPFALSKAATKTKTELTDAIDKHNQLCSELTERIEALRAVQDINWTDSHEAESTRLRGQRVELLKAELVLRERIAEYFDAIANVEVSAAINSAVQEKQAAAKDIAGKLLEIGYVDDEYGRTLPDLIARHPRIKAARLRIEGNSPQPPLAAMQANTEGVAECRDELAKLRQAATAGLPEPELDAGTVPFPPAVVCVM